MEIKKITDYIDFLLSAALSKCGNIYDAEDLVQETVLSAIAYLSSGGEIADIKPWLSSVLNHKFYDMLRKKYKIPTVTVSSIAESVGDEDFISNIIRENEAENIRKEVAFLAESYRSIIVKHYFFGKSVKELASELNIPAGTVKSRLNFGREQLKKGMNEMKNYTQNSYMPQYLAVRNSGTCGINEEPMSLTEGDALAQNLLILAYEKPVTVTELSKAIGVAGAYTEPVIAKLVNGELMKRTGDGKVYTDFIIYHEDDYVKYIKEQEAFAKKYSELFFRAFENAAASLKATNFYSLRLERFMIIQIAESGLYGSMESLRAKPQIFPERPNGGRWIAFGTIRPENYTIPENKRGKEEYMLAGRRETVISQYLNGENLKLYNYETSLDKFSFQKHCGFGFNFFQDVETNMLKLFYILKHGIAPESVDLDTRIIKGIPLLKERGFIGGENGTAQVLIPCLTHEEEKIFFEICGKAAKAFGESIKNPLGEYCRTHKMKIPPHLKSVPDQKLTMPYEPSPMMFVYEAVKSGLHPRDLGCLCPETVAVFD